MTPTFLELCAAYSKAHAAHAEALAAAEAAFTGRARVWKQASAEHKAAEVLDTDYNAGDGLEVLIEAEKVGDTNGRRFWVPHDSLKRTEPTA